MPEIQIVPSILASDLLRLGEQVQAAERGGAGRFQIDVMDGVFVPNISFGMSMVKAMRRATALPLEAHLMIVQPERYIEEFAKAGADVIIVHQEVSPHLDRTIAHIKQTGKRAGVALNPSTPPAVLEQIIQELDQVLVMTVNPGFGGQHFIPYSVQKIEQVRAMLARRNPDCDLEVDGGIEPETILEVVLAGANLLVAGTTIFGHPEGPEAGIRSLTQALG